MAVTFTKEFWTNLILFIVACVALALSIFALNVRCKNDSFGDFIKDGNNIYQGVGTIDDPGSCMSLRNSPDCPYSGSEMKENINMICGKGLTCRPYDDDNLGKCETIEGTGHKEQSCKISY